MTSPACTVNASSSLNGVNVTAASGVTIALADVGGVSQWSLTCIGVDDTNVAATITAGLAINQTNKTATFTAPAAGSALVFQSVVNNGKDINGNVVPAYTTTFGIYVLSAGGFRVGAINETTEGDSVYGWTSKFNALLRGAIALAVLAVAPTPNTVAQRDSSGGLKAAFFDSGAAADLPIKRNGSTIATILATGLQFNVTLTSTAISQLANTGSLPCSDLTITPQAPFSGAGGSNRNPGSLVVSLADPTNGQAIDVGSPAFKVKQGGTQYVAMGRRLNNGVSTYGAVWCGSAAPTEQNMCFGADGAGVCFLNCPTGGTIYLTFGVAMTGLELTAGSLNFHPTFFAWDLAATTPSLIQSNQTANSTNGQPLKVQAQNATGLTSTGGQLTLTSGTGTTAPGNVVLQTGGTDRVTVAPTTVTLTPPTLQWAASVNATVALTQADQTTGSTNGQKLVGQAQNATGATSNGGDAQWQGGGGTTAGGQALLQGGAGITNGNGGNAVVSGGLHAGAGADGSVLLKTGATTRVTLTTTTFQLNAGQLQQLRNVATYGTTTVFDYSLGNHQQVTFGAGNITTLTQNNPLAGAVYTHVFIQDATGSRTLAVPGTWKTAGSAFVLSIGANKRDSITMIWDGTNYVELSRSMNM